MLNDEKLAVDAAETLGAAESCRGVKSSSLGDGISALARSWTEPSPSRSRREGGSPRGEMIRAVKLETSMARREYVDFILGRRVLKQHKQYSASCKNPTSQDGSWSELIYSKELH